jgi:hypothetical protein
VIRTDTVPCGKPAVAECADCGISICSNCRVECCSDSFCGYCYDYHVTHSCLRKPVQNERNPLSNITVAHPGWPKTGHAGSMTANLKASDSYNVVPLPYNRVSVKDRSRQECLKPSRPMPSLFRQVHWERRCRRWGHRSSGRTPAARQPRLVLSGRTDLPRSPFQKVDFGLNETRIQSFLCGKEAYFQTDYIVCAAAMSAR